MERYLVEPLPWSGVEAVRLADRESAAAALLVPSLGGNMISLTDRDEELLRRPPDSETLRQTPTRWGIPVLMPPNRIRGGRFRYGGREYQLERYDKDGHHIHGFPIRRLWSVRESGSREGARVTIDFTAADHPDVIAQFPHPFVLSLTYTLRGRSLRCDSRIRNNGKEPMPFGLGFHPYLIAPADRVDRFAIRLTENRPWAMDGKFPTGVQLEADPERDLHRWQLLHGSRWDAGFALTSRESDGWSRFELDDRERGRVVTLRASREFGHWVIFNGGPEFSGFVCPEPYTCMTDAFNLDLSPSLTGMTAVGPGEERQAGSWELTW